MKISLLSVLAAVAPFAVGAPTPTEEGNAEHVRIVKRATITDIADTGYATQNGG